jgi:riboflavin synthase
MFTGIVEDRGKVTKARRRGDLVELEIEARPVARSLKRGDSVAVNGVCLTAVASGRRRFAVEVTPETAARSALGNLAPGDRVNLELPARLSDRMGGHLVQGHVDGRAHVVRVEDEGDTRRGWFAADTGLLRYIVEKGSVAIDGVSLTVTGVGPADFQVVLIPHTLSATTLNDLRVDDVVNVEVDVIAKYVERLVTPEGRGG